MSDDQLPTVLLVMGVALIVACVIRGWLVKRQVDRQLDERDDDVRGIGS